MLDVVRAEAAQFNRYPDLFATGLTAAIAERFDVPVSHIATGTGSVGVLQQVIQSVATAGDEVVYAWRSFEAYPIVVQISGATSVTVPLTPDERHDLDAMAAAITDRTRLVHRVLAEQPHGYGGAARRARAVPRPRTERGARRDRRGLPRVRARPATFPTALDVYRDRPNVAVLRTFSKAYGLAGLRVGFACRARSRR